MEKICAFDLCKKHFSPSRKDNIFCSKKCKKKSYYWRDREDIIKRKMESKPIKFCSICHQIQIKNNFKYCSNCVLFKIKEWKQKEYKNHLEHYRIRARINQVKYINSSPVRMIRTLLRNRFRGALKAYTLSGKIKNSKTYGVSYEQIINKLEKDLGRKLEWEDLTKNHIHHIKELVTFNLQDESQIQLAFSPENTILLPREKHREISKEFLSKWRMMNNNLKDSNHIYKHPLLQN